MADSVEMAVHCPRVGIVLFCGSGDIRLRVVVPWEMRTSGYLDNTWVLWCICVAEFDHRDVDWFQK